jgi:hypothetical protein
MMRGGAVALAAQLLCGSPVVSVLTAQVALVRTRDVGFAAVEYDNGLTLGAASLYQTLSASRDRGTLDAAWLVSMFTDGRWSMQGALAGARSSLPIPMAPAFARMFRTMRGEVAVSTTSTAQQGFMPTFQVDASSRLRLESENRELALGARVARTFDGTEWRTTMLGETRASVRSGSRIYSARFTPMQLQDGDLLSDMEGGFVLPIRRTVVDATLGVRLGEARRGTVAWGTVNVTVPLFAEFWTTFSVGNYPVELLQGLPGARYAAINFRLPGARFPWRRVPVVPASMRRAPDRPELPTSESLALVIGSPYDSLQLREVRVWAPGVDEVEVVADFTDWVPVPLVKERPGEWRGYYRVEPGAHRLNVRLNHVELGVPANLVRVADDFSGLVGVVIVR